MRRRQVYQMRQEQEAATAALSESMSEEKSLGDGHIELIAKPIESTFPIIEKPRRGRPPRVKSCP